MTFEDNQIDYKLEIRTLREFMGKADSLEKYDNLIKMQLCLYLIVTKNGYLMQG